jgi:predicted ATPase
MHALTNLHITNYGAIRDVRFELTPLHCLIGPRLALLEVASEAIRLSAARNGVQVCCLRNPELDVYPTDIPAKIAMLRRASDVQQVLLVTQNPLVVNELQGTEVSLITPNDEGWLVATRLSDTHNFLNRSATYALGELWVHYCIGGDERGGLLKGDDNVSAES